MDRRTRARIYIANSDTKRRILQAILAEAKNLSELAREFDMAPASIYQHGCELEEAGLVTKEHIGRRAYLVPTALAREILRE